MNQTAAGAFQEGKKALFSATTVLLLIKGCISLILLSYLFWKTDRQQFIQTVYTLRPHLLIFTGLLYLGCQYLNSYRWQVLLKAHDVTVPVNRLFLFNLVGMFFNNVLPTSIGGDVVKGYDLYRYTGKGKESITTVFLGRYTGVVAVILIGLGALAIGYTSIPDPMIAIMMGAIATAFVVGTMIVANRYIRVICLKITQRFHVPGVGRAISGLYDTVGKYKHHKDIFLYSIVISVGLQLLNILVYILLADSLGISVHWGYFFIFFPIVTVITMLPISFNGLGIREGMFIYLFSKLEIPSAQALSLSLSWIFVVTCISLLGGLIFALRKEV